MANISTTGCRLMVTALAEASALRALVASILSSMRSAASYWRSDRLPLRLYWLTSDAAKSFQPVICSSPSMISSYSMVMFLSVLVHFWARDGSPAGLRTDAQFCLFTHLWNGVHTMSGPMAAR